MSPKHPSHRRPADERTNWAEWLYRNIRYIGIQMRRYTRRFGRRLLRLLKRPVYMVGTMLYAVWLFVDRHALKWLHTSSREVRRLVRDISASHSHIRRAVDIDGEKRSVVYRRYAKVALERYSGLFRRMVNILLPVVGCIVMIATISYFSGVTFALQINYNGESLGYIANEAVYAQARDSANELIGMDGEEGQNVIKSQPVYALKIVDQNKLTDVQTLRDRLIEASDYNLTNACGIYIDGSFLCAVRNETDAIRVLDTLLEPVRQQNPGTLVDFVEEVEYVQGLYPDTEETMWDADKLLDTISGTKEAAVYYTVAEGDTVSGIAQKYDKSSSELFAMNPGLTEEIHIGDVLTVSNEVRFLQVRVIKTEQRNEEIPYDTVRTNTDTLMKGITKTTREGEVGIDRVTELVSYVDGIRVSAEEVSRERIKDPVDEEVSVGTRSVAGLPGGTIVQGSGSMAWPVDGLYQISSPYGYRWGRFHSGVDISGGGAYGHVIRAAESGTVEYAGYDGDYGYNIIINHGSGLKTRYAHCSSLGVSYGEYVEKGQAIGRVGSTGNSTGPHLHFEVYKYGTRVNPLDYISR